MKKQELFDFDGQEPVSVKRHLNVCYRCERENVSLIMNVMGKHVCFDCFCSADDEFHPPEMPDRDSDENLNVLEAR